MTSFKNRGPEIFAFIIIALLGIPYGWWATAYVMVHIWSWYRPEFLPMLPFKAALGASFVVATLKTHKIEKSDETETGDLPWGKMIGALLTPWLVMVFARIALWVFFE